jgi:hypothetical protein
LFLWQSSEDHLVGELRRYVELRVECPREVGANKRSPQVMRDLVELRKRGSMAIGTERRKTLARTCVALKLSGDRCQEAGVGGPLDSSSFRGVEHQNFGLHP